MQIKIFEPVTDEILTRADTDNMRLPFEQGWEQYLVTDQDGQILAVCNDYRAAADFRLPLTA